MNKDITKSILVIAGACLFNLVFWQEKLGINILLFDVFIIAALFYLYPNAGQYSTVRWLLPGHLLCLAMVLVHNTQLSKIAFTVTLLLIAAFSEYKHRSAWFAGGSVVMNIVMVAASFGESLKLKKANGVKRGTITRFIRFAFFPLVIALIFFVIYFSANSVFQEKVSVVLDELVNYINRFFGLISWERALFLLLGLFITGCILLRSKLDYFTHKETAYGDDLQRTKKPWKKRREGSLFRFIELVMGRFARGNMALKNENTTGLISILLLNFLLLIINIIDIDYLWFNFVYNERQPIYKMVHEGAEWLILSIVLAMAILMFFFKGNLNFYRRNKWLKYGATAWIVQNSVLVFSVFLRDYYYIQHHGLAYKRIGVLFFLLMVIIGLITVLIKIWFRKSNYFLFRVNAWAGIIILVFSTTLHWDEVIAEYNLKRKTEIALDVPFLFSLSDKTLPLLEKNRDVLEKSSDPYYYINQLQQREQYFLQKQQGLTWLSWNYADATVKQYLARNQQVHFLNTDH